MMLMLHKVSTFPGMANAAGHPDTKAYASGGGADVRRYLLAQPPCIAAPRVLCALRKDAIGLAC